MRKLDRIDRMILYILQRDGRIAISELAARVNLSTTPCSERVKRLERDGIIMGYYARLNPEKLERNLLVFLEIKLSAKSGDVFEQVARDLSEIPEVLECHAGRSIKETTLFRLFTQLCGDGGSKRDAISGCRYLIL